MAVKADAMTETQARKALNKLLEKQAELELVRRQAGIPKLEAEIDAAKRTVIDFMDATDTDQLLGDGAHATLVRASYDSHFVGTNDEIPDWVERRVIPLRTIIYKKLPKEEAAKLWQRVTKRVVVPEMVEEVVAEGLLEVDEISPSFVEKLKKPYIRISRD